MGKKPTAGTVSIQIRCADLNGVVAVLDSFHVAVRELNLPLILIDTALPGSAVKGQFNRRAGGKMSGGAGEEGATVPLLKQPTKRATKVMPQQACKSSLLRRCRS